MDGLALLSECFPGVDVHVLESTLADNGGNVTMAAQCLVEQAGIDSDSGSIDDSLQLALQLQAEASPHVQQVDADLQLALQLHAEAQELQAERPTTANKIKLVERTNRAKKLLAEKLSLSKFHLYRSHARGVSTTPLLAGSEGFSSVEESSVPVDNAPSSSRYAQRMQRARAANSVSRSVNYSVPPHPSASAEVESSSLIESSA